MDNAITATTGPIFTPEYHHQHQPVLLAETLALLQIDPAGCYVDATFGRGGHTAAILAALNAHGRVFALDRDPAAATWAKTTFSNDPRLVFTKAPFSQLCTVLEQQGLIGKINGILLDLGVSSPQLNDAARGFSFQNDGPLDMRMDTATGLSAADWLQQVRTAELEQVLVDYGEERFYRRVARTIIAARENAPITTTAQLAHIVSTAVPTREPGKHPATRTFQAIRIAINQELHELQTVLPQTVQLLAPSGRLVVISFHSLEDRMVKQFLRAQAAGHVLPLGLPVQGKPQGATVQLIGRAVRPSTTEVAANPRARSAVLRVAERLP